MSKKWCLEVLKDVNVRHGKPEILNLDQGTQYTSLGWINYLEDNQNKVSTNGKGRATDIAWIERFFKSVKDNQVHHNPCNTGLEFFDGVKRYIDYYHRKRHQAIKMSPTTDYAQSMRNQAAGTTKH
jgi:putative transposase